MTRRIRNQFLTLLLLDHTRPFEQPPGDREMSANTCERSERLALAISGPESMAGVDVFGQWFTVDLRNDGPAVEKMDMSVMLPDGFHVRVIRPELSDGRLGFAFFATSPGETPGRVDCLGGALSSGAHLVLRILVTTCEPSEQEATVVAVTRTIEPEVPVDDAIQCSCYHVSIQ